MNDVIDKKANYKLIRLLFKHEAEGSERLIREFIQQMILKKRAKVLSGPGTVNDREDVRIALVGAKVNFSSPGNDIVPPADTLGHLVDLSAGGACIKIPVDVKLHKRAPAFIRLDFIRSDLEVECSVLGLR